MDEGLIERMMERTAISGEASTDRADAVHRDVDGHGTGGIDVPREAAEAAIWLASPAASFITGHALAVDGGYAAQ
ncbi:SDR family oxidoreductase [uncultured Parvibaculum sp.]|uniref:SDR family oxidoreductase n=1 Tax=uncultured Parvibaculum sp. TaxID=291828 RepID=UPI0030DA7840|tara:strand:+ start:91939 stop:92163 length:225 start_codon:yes stop_codon:yes gene_type:complete